MHSNSTKGDRATAAACQWPKLYSFNHVLVTMLSDMPFVVRIDWLKFAGIISEK